MMRRKKRRITRMRIMSSIYDRQRELEIFPMKHAVVGAGGIGSWVAILSAMSGDEVHVFDDDAIEEHNLNRLPFTLEDVGRPKVEALEEFLERLGRKCYGYNMKVRHPSQVLVIDPNFVTIAVDDMKIAEKIASACIERGTCFACVNYDGDHVTLRFNISPDNEFDADEQQGYSVIPSWVAPPAFIASIVVFTMHRKAWVKKIYSFNLSKLLEVMPCLQ